MLDFTSRGRWRDTGGTSSDSEGTFQGQLTLTPSPWGIFPETYTVGCLPYTAFPGTVEGGFPVSPFCTWPQKNSVSNAPWSPGPSPVERAPSLGAWPQPLGWWLLPSLHSLTTVASNTLLELKQLYITFSLLNCVVSCLLIESGLTQSQKASKTVLRSLLYQRLVTFTYLVYDFMLDMLQALDKSW